eukprot:2115367-Rhodomonas_salina.1
MALCQRDGCLHQHQLEWSSRLQDVPGRDEFVIPDLPCLHVCARACSSVFDQFDEGTDADVLAKGIHCSECLRCGVKLYLDPSVDLADGQLCCSGVLQPGPSAVVSL